MARGPLTFLTLALVAGSLAATEPARITARVLDNDRVTLQGNVHPALASRMPTGHADYARPMERMILVLKLSPTAQARLDKLHADQQDPASPSFHQWLTPAQFADQFGPAKEDLAQVMGWLMDQGFSIDEVAAGGLTINFSGDVARVERAFHTTIMDFQVDGAARHGNVSDPSIPAALADVVHGVVSLHNIPRPAHSLGAKKLSAQDAARVAAKADPQWKGTANGTAGVYLGPTDWATIYDANTTYTANGTGTGVTIGIVGRTNPGTTNWAKFRSTLGLPLNTPTIVVNGTNPGDLGAGEDGEADLDAEWSGGVAPGATVKFVASKSTSSTDGVDLSAQYIVNNNYADVMSTSFGQCETSMGGTENAFYNNLWSQAASEGITACVSTGDSGAAGCTGGSSTSGSGYSGVNGLASTPYNLAIGATQLSTSSAYWTTAGAPNGYIPETPWNESGLVSGGSGLWATSSGASNTYARPSWQVAPGVPTGTKRLLPDISLDGSDMFFGNYGMLVYTQGAMATTGGTSAASPSFAGVMALVVQKYGRQGNANPILYQMGTRQYGSAGPAVYHDITSGNNNVPGLTGFTAAAGWDEATGLGTPDVTVLVNNWSATVTAPTIVTQPAAQTVTVGATATFTVSASGSALTYQWYKNSAAVTGATAASYTTPATTSADNGATFYVTVTNSAGSVQSANAALTVNPVAAPVITTQPASASVAAGATATFSVTATGASLTYQWYKNGAAVSGATAAAYTTPATTAADSGATFYVVVTNSAGSVTSATATLTVTAVTSYTEVEANNTIATANAVPDTAGTIKGFIGSTTDVDYFKVKVGAGVTLKVGMTGPSNKDYDLYLYNASGTRLASSTGSTATESLSYTNTGTAAVYYYINVKGYNRAYSTTVAYTLTLTR